MFSKSLFSLALLYFSSISAHAMNADNTLGANDTVGQYATLVLLIPQPMVKTCV